MTKEKLAFDSAQTKAFARLVEDAGHVDNHLTEVFQQSRADPFSKAFILSFLEGTMWLLDSLGVTGPLPKSAEAVDSTRADRALAWLRRNRWHLIAYSGLVVTVLVLLRQLNEMNHAIHVNRALINAHNIELQEAAVQTQEQLKQLKALLESPK